MLDSPTLKAVVTTVAVIVLIFCIGVAGSAIGHGVDQPVEASPEYSPDQRDATTRVASHNVPGAPTRATPAEHNRP